MKSERFYVITGASGAGKSTILKALGSLGYSCVPEIALAIVQEQEQCGGTLFPWTHPQAFMEEVLARNIQAYDAAQALPPPVFFDRGIPECLAHMRLLGLRVRPDHVVEAAKRYYARKVFVAEPWADVYVRDQWRHATFERAARSFEPTVAAYAEKGYRTCVLPQVPVPERVAFILEQLEAGA
ncbi:AAA family ATPase [Longimicrobium sp.]|uniref:AAA family ATPase n=1 Tax=Longimicrobium sp. TaxID=2029185 RepID=UPI002E35D26D|nr:AAA family ATPase [Longimicrobium sp.]HEX6039365.1 AAA family ATPase [Longimicrobium sp.]